jgi:hypothetical protein
MKPVAPMTRTRTPDSMPFVSLFQEVRSAARSIARTAGERAYAKAPPNLQEAVEKIRRRYENGRIDARKALEDLSELEERALKVVAQFVLFPWATAGAIRELYGRMRELEGAVEKRDRTIRLLEDRIRELERGGPPRS